MNEQTPKQRASTLALKCANEINRIAGDSCDLLTEGKLSTIISRVLNLEARCECEDGLREILKWCSQDDEPFEIDADRIGQTLAKLDAANEPKEGK